MDVIRRIILRNEIRFLETHSQKMYKIKLSDDHTYNDVSGIWILDEMLIL